MCQLFLKSDLIPPVRQWFPSEAPAKAQLTLLRAFSITEGQEGRYEVRVVFICFFLVSLTCKALGSCVVTSSESR